MAAVLPFPIVANPAPLVTPILAPFAPIAPGLDSAAPTTPRPRVLIVDDDEDIAVLVHSLLDDAEIDVEWASDHDSAIEAIRDDSYAALLIDYHLGSTDGVQLIHELQIRGYDAPMLMLTGSDDPKVDAAAMEAGATNFLAKDELTGPGLSRAIRYARQRHIDLTRLKLMADSMRHDASTDALTRLGNRRAFDLDLARLVDSHGTGGLLMIDIDDLKLINDRRGHVSGDFALRTVAERIRGTIRSDDAAYRIGGDEFAVITRVPGLTTFGHRLAVVLSRVVSPDSMITASVGWAERGVDDTAAQLLQRADEVLYANKRLRRTSAVDRRPNR